MKEHDEKRQEEIKVAGTPRTGGQPKLSVRSQDTRVGTRRIWVRNEAWLQAYQGRTVGQESSV